MEHDNLRVALAWGIESGNADLSQNTAASLTWFWVVRRHMAEAADWFARVLGRRRGFFKRTCISTSSVRLYRLGGGSR